MPYALREALAAFRRTPLLTTLSIVAIAVSLVVVGLFSVTAFNIHLGIQQIEERVEIVAYLWDSATPEQVRAAREEIEAMPEVASLRYVSKVEALEIARQELVEYQDILGDIEDNPLPASLEVRVHPAYRQAESIYQLARTLSTYAFVEDVRFGQEWLDRIFALRRIAGGVTLVIGGAFALVAAIIIGSAIRVAVFARREEISIMRMVGATDGFVRRPFLLEGAIAGALGGLVAAGLTYAAYRSVSATFLPVEWIPDAWIAYGIAAGTLFGLVSASLSVKRHLRAV